MTTGEVVAIVIGGIVGLALLVASVVYILIPIWRGTRAFIRHCFRFCKAVVQDSLRAIGGFVAAPIYATLGLVGLATNRPDAQARFLTTAKDEGLRGLVATYRVFIGHPLRFLGAQRIVERLETGLPPAIEDVWGEVLTPSTQLFPGYQVLRTIPGGGSGAKLYVAVPHGNTSTRVKDALKRLEQSTPAGSLALPGTHTRETSSPLVAEGTVIIKSFALSQGSQLPQIVRESRAIEAGKALGLILDDGLTPERFWYAMHYVPGDNLRIALQSLHTQPGCEQGLQEPQLRQVLRWMSDLLSTLQRYHEAGLWHKDVKPDNIIIEQGPTQRAVLVDLGLVSSLGSAMTLTTHGTEYFRDPEMVRRALRGVRVMDVDGVRFDVYSAGAVLYAMIENSFPAQSELSPLSKACPPALAWIIRRAMTHYDQRYATAAAMLADVQALLKELDLAQAAPASLPSMRSKAPLLGSS
jgi:serine/threonine protein kinase